MSNAIKRAIRAFLQSFTGVLISSYVLSVASETGIVDWSGLKKVVLSAIAAGVVAVLTWVQNALEDANVIPEIVPKNGS